MHLNRFAKLQIVALSLLIILINAHSAMAGVSIGEKATPFSLPGIDGRTYELVENEETRMTVLYFFDTGSRTSKEGSRMLGGLLKRYTGRQLVIWGITRSTRPEVLEFSKQAQLEFPILLDAGKVSQQYGARIVLPVFCILGSDGKVLDYIQGGGEGSQTILVNLARSQLHRNQPQLAAAIGEVVAEKHPENLEAKAIQGYSALKMGEPQKAQKVFDQIAALPGQGNIIGKEGQAAVMAHKGKTSQALALIEDVAHKAPKRGLLQKIKGDLLAANGATRAAQKAYEKAATLSEGDTLQKAEVHNQLGRLYAQSGNYEKARAQFDNAVELDPWYIEPTSNKGVTYEKEGQWTKALKEYRRALKLNDADTIASVLAQKAEKMLAIQNDAAKKQRMDRLVDDLAKMYKQQKAQGTKKDQDEWTSQPMLLTFLDLKESGGLAARDGLSMVLSTRLGELLNESGRVQVVEREIMEHLLSELKLGASELADTNTTLKLGRVLATRLIGTGSLIYLPGSTLLNIRLVDTETSAIAKTVTLQLPPDVDLEREIFNLNRTVIRSVMEKYPLRGYVVEVDNDEVVINLGSNQGMTPGSMFEVIEEGETKTYKGKVMRSAPKRMGQLEVVRIEPDFCYARVKQQKREFKADDKVREIMPDVMLKGALGNAN